MTDTAKRFSQLSRAKELTRNTLRYMTAFRRTTIMSSGTGPSAPSLSGMRHIPIACRRNAHRRNGPTCPQPETKLAFQPGTFQIKMGRDALKGLYAATEVFACNKEEAQNILGVGEIDIKTLLKNMHSLGPKIVLITDGRNGAYAFDGTQMLKVPMYPDPKPPVDRTGAGDAMASTFVAALALGKPLQEALLWGPINSMAVVQEIGAQKGLLSREALERYLAEAPPEYRVESL